MTYRLGRGSRSRLARVHQDLVILVSTAIADPGCPVDFTVLEGRRTLLRQKQLVKQGASKTLNSRHLTGHAVDIAPWINGSPSWHWSHYEPLAEHMKAVAKRIGITVEWGGDWKWRDGPHWQLPRSVK